ncbi:OsmC family protein [Aeromonas cavernicola]|uniref:Peroxiredoxin n=1 Tax=Aeromonas cavernicola TaxID=1006623 RepID=A0A2H9U234_9GAMM|nr:OsmC family protein [Aeromonas cavernicola]PJG58112.1 peroxiredoxin [Aeromonas cavernicola]
MNAEITWVEQLTFLATADSGHGVVIDAPVDKGGNNRGSSPMELLLMGVGSCTGIDVLNILEKSRQHVTGLRINIESVREQEDPKVFTAIKIIYRFSGHNLSRTHVERAVNLSAEKYCCVSIMLGKTATIAHEIIIEEQ